MADRNKRSYKERFQDSVEFIIPNSFLRDQLPKTIQWNSNRDFKLSLKQDSESASCIWDASIILSSFLLEQHESYQFNGKRCLEIGSGCGLSGLVMGFLCKETLLTDLGEVMPILHDNVDSNQILWKEWMDSSLLNEGDQLNELKWNVKAMELFWGSDCSSLEPPLDVIIGADVVYEIQAFDLLVASLRDLSGPDTDIFISLEHRWSDVEKFFFEEIEKHFTWTKIDRKIMDNLTFTKSNVDIYRMKKK